MSTLDILRRMQQAAHDLEGIEHHMPRPHWHVMKARLAAIQCGISELEAILSRQQQTVIIGVNSMEEVGE